MSVCYLAIDLLVFYFCLLGLMVKMIECSLGEKKQKKNTWESSLCGLRNKIDM